MQFFRQFIKFNLLVCNFLTNIPLIALYPNTYMLKILILNGIERKTEQIIESKANCKLYIQTKLYFKHGLKPAFYCNNRHMFLRDHKKITNRKFTHRKRLS